MSDAFGSGSGQPGSEGVHLISTATLSLDDPKGAVQTLIEQAQLHRGSLREQDGFTIPFREGGSVRFRVAEQGLRLRADAPTPERLDYIQRVVGNLVREHLEGAQELEWSSEGGTSA